MAHYRDHGPRRTSASSASPSDDGRDDSSRHQEDDFRSPETVKGATQADRLEPTSPHQYESQDPKFWEAFAVILTLVFCAVIVIVVKVYSRDIGMPDKQKHAYETVSTGLLLFLGLNFNVSRWLLWEERERPQLDVR